MTRSAVPRPSARRVVALLGALVLGAGVLAGCGTDPAGNAGGAPQSPGSTEAATTVGGVQHLTVTADDMLRFDQTDLTAHTGMVEITLDVPGMTEHDLLFTDGPGGGTSEISASSTSITLDFPQPGTFHFTCTIHPRMRGTLTVS